MWASRREIECAISRKTVSIVPSAGSRTDSYAASAARANAAATSIGSTSSPGPARELLGRAADDLAEDHARVAARPHQRGARERVDQLGAADLVDHLPVEAVELVAHGAQGERHVVAGVAVGDREHVEVVDLLAPLLEVGGGGADDAAESLYRGIGHAGSDGTLDPGGAFASVLGGLRDLVRLQAARADVDARGCRRLLLDPDLLQVRVEAPPGRDHRVAPRVAEGGALAAAVTDLGHGTGHGSEGAGPAAVIQRRTEDDVLDRLN